MPTLTGSRSDALKPEIMDALRALPDCRVEGNWAEIKKGLGFNPKEVSNNVLTSALWKLVNDGQLRCQTVRDPFDADSRGFCPVVNRIYWIPTV